MHAALAHPTAPDVTPRMPMRARLAAIAIDVATIASVALVLAAFYCAPRLEPAVKSMPAT